jgi:tetratricopeptide (TPR) repeat protein
MLPFLYWSLTTFYAGNWHPLTWLSHTIDYTLWGLNPLGHHLTNIILHGLNTLFVFFLVIQLIKKAKEQGRSALSPPSSTKFIIVPAATALLFGLHPLHVESVAWVSERKDLLCAFFFLLSILSYLYYVPLTTKKYRRILFSICLLLFIFALMSKPMAVTLPLILILLDIYPLKRISFYPNKINIALSIWLEKIPFFALSLTSSIITLMAQHSGGAVKTLEQLPISYRLLNATRSLVFYLEKMIIPLKLIPLYPFPRHLHWLDVPIFWSGLIFFLITIFCLWMVKRGNHLFLVLWSYYLITLLPVLGIIQVGGHAAADRYTYLPSISIFLLSGLGILWIFEKIELLKFKNILQGVLLLITCMLMLLGGRLTINQTKIWKNSEVLWSYVINTSQEGVPLAHGNLGIVYADTGRLDDAISEYKKAITIEPRYAEAYSNLGIAYADKGRLDDAISEYKKAITIEPRYAKAYNNLGIAYANKGELDGAISAFKKALIIEPNKANAHYNLGIAYERKSLQNEAASQFKKAIELNRNYIRVYIKLGSLFIAQGKEIDAVNVYRKAIRYNPGDHRLYNNLAWIYATSINKNIRDGEEAVTLATRACELIGFKEAFALGTLAAAYAEKGNFNKAIEYQMKAIELVRNKEKPDFLSRLELYRSGQPYRSQ